MQKKDRLVWADLSLQTKWCCSNKANINISHTCESRYPEFGINGIGLSEFLFFCLYMKIYS